MRRSRYATPRYFRHARRCLRCHAIAAYAMPRFFAAAAAPILDDAFTLLLLCDTRQRLSLPPLLICYAQRYARDGFAAARYAMPISDR